MTTSTHAQRVSQYPTDHIHPLPPAVIGRGKVELTAAQVDALYLWPAAVRGRAPRRRSGMSTIEPTAVTVARGKPLAVEDAGPITSAELFVRFATWATQLDGEIQDVAVDLADALTPHLSSEQTADWWHELRTCLIGRERASTGGPAFDEVGVDWDAGIVEAAERLAGVW
jgi:hypothetical protein